MSNLPRAMHLLRHSQEVFYAILTLGAINAAYNILSHYVIQLDSALQRNSISSLGLAFTYFLFLDWHPQLLIKSVPLFGYPSKNGFNYTVLAAVITLIVAVITHIILTEVLGKDEEAAVVKCEHSKTEDL